MATIVVLHSILGRRMAEARLMALWRAAGHEVVVPDLYVGERTDAYPEGFAIHDRIGHATLVQRAQAAVAAIAADAILAGISMGAGIVGEVWRERPATRGVLLLHGPCEIPSDARPGTPVQMHLAEPDPYESEDFIAQWSRAAATRVALEVFRYPAAGHYFLDPALPDHDAIAAAHALARVGAFLQTL